MLKSRNLFIESMPPRKDFGVVGMLPEAIAELKFVGFDVRLQLQAKDRLISLDDEKRKNCVQELAGFQTGSTPPELCSMIRVAFGMVVNVGLSAKLFAEKLYDRLMGHTNSDANLVADVRGVRLIPSINAGDSLSIKQTGNVCDFHRHPLVVTDMSANSGNTQNGQSRTKQAARPGARREQVPTAKAKICSELRGNTQTLAEMTRGLHVGADYSTHDALTDCNTNYLFFRPHRDRNFVPIGGERQSVNQDAIVKLIGWAGNLCTSNSSLQGVLIA